MKFYLVRRLETQSPEGDRGIPLGRRRLPRPAGGASSFGKAACVYLRVMQMSEWPHHLLDHGEGDALLPEQRRGVPALLRWPAPTWCVRAFCAFTACP